MDIRTREPIKGGNLDFAVSATKELPTYIVALVNQEYVVLKLYNQLYEFYCKTGDSLPSARNIVNKLNKDA